MTNIKFDKRTVKRLGYMPSIILGECETTGKRQFKKRKDVLKSNKANPKKVRAYRCEHCDLWHATTTPERKV